jgi:glutathione synthase/RimK-type ligase-like ATP-grasp enzyme
VRWDGDEPPRADVVATVIRTTWDYTQQITRFLDWIEHTEHLVNAAPLVRWNADKHYLADLARAGVPTPETHYLPRSSREVRARLSAMRRDFVVKPTVSAGARDTGRFRPDELDAAEALVGSIHASGRDAMLQPYLPAIEAHGETALFYFDGAFSHAVRKPALLATGPKIDQFARGFVEPRTPSRAEREVAEGALRALGELGLPAPMQARIDLVPSDDGAPLLLEAELIEPRLFLGTSEGAASRYARALRAHVQRTHVEQPHLRHDHGQRA